MRVIPGGNLKSVKRPAPFAMLHTPPRVLMVLCLGLVTPRALAAQLVLEARGGVTLTSDLVEDVIVDEIAVGPRPAPTLAIAIGTVLDARYAVSVEGTWSHSDLERRGDDATRVLALTVWTASVSIRRRVIGGLWTHGAIGALKYAPASHERDGTLFQEEAPLRPMLGLGARYERGLTPALALGVDVGWDVHRFTTRSLRADGFDGESIVHRLTFGIIVGKRHDRPSP